MVAQLAGSRIMGHDPLGFAAGDVNLYRFVSNDPINQVDPSGLQGNRVVIRYEMIPKGDDHGGPKDRVYVNTIKEIADHIRDNLPAIDRIERIQIGTHGGPGYITRTMGDPASIQLESNFPASALRYARTPQLFPNLKRTAESDAALKYIRTRMCEGGKLEIIGCQCFDESSPGGPRFKRDLESIFGPGNVIGYQDTRVWTPEGEAITLKESKTRQSGFIGRIIDSIVNSSRDINPGRPLCDGSTLDGRVYRAQP